MGRIIAAIIMFMYFGWLGIPILICLMILLSADRNHYYECDCDDARGNFPKKYYPIDDEDY